MERNSEKYIFIFRQSVAPKMERKRLSKISEHN